MNASARRTVFRAAGLLLLILLAATAVFAIRSAAGPYRTFKQLAVSPIPASIHRMKMDRFWITHSRRRPGMYSMRAVVLRLDVSREDLLKIVDARGLKRSGKSMWGEGAVAWDITGSLDFLKQVPDVLEIYPKRRSPPHWFDLPNWENPETYFLTQSDPSTNVYTDATFLFYNEGLGSAYFIKWEQRSP